MTRNDDFIGQLEGYLDEYEGGTPLPEDIRDAIRAQLPTTKQIGPPSGPRRYPSMFKLPVAARYGLVAAGIVLVAAVGASVLGRGTGGQPEAIPPQATALPVATPGELPTAASLEAGTYFIANAYADEDPFLNCNGGCPDFRTVTFTLPDGWAVSDGHIFKHRGQSNEVAFSVWAPGAIYPDPCQWQNTPGWQEIADDPTLESGPWGPADAGTLASQAGREGSTPTPVTFGGEQNAGIVRRVELSVPADLDISACHQGQYRSWTVWQVPDSANSHHAAGQVDVVYVVNLDRRPLMIDASHMPAASQEDLAELEAIVDSVVIDRGF